MDKFFHNLNKVHSSVSFSKEVEADGQLTHLDVLLTKKWEGNRKKYSYRKNTHTGLYNEWESLSPIPYEKVSYKACCTAPTEFAAHTNWSTKNFNILNPCFLTMDTQTGLYTDKNISQQTLWKHSFKKQARKVDWYSKNSSIHALPWWHDSTTRKRIAKLFSKIPERTFSTVSYS